MRTCQLLHQIGNPTEQVMAVALSPDGRRVISGSMRQTRIATVRAWDTTSGLQVWSQADHANEVLAIDFSRDGTVLATASADGIVKLREAATGKVLRSLDGHDGGATSIAFSADGMMLVCGAGYGANHLWDVQSGQRLRKCAPTGSWLRSVTTDRLFNVVAFNPDGNSFVSCAATMGNTHGEPVRFWDTQTGKLKNDQIDDKTHGRPIALSPDGSILAAGGKSIKLFDVQSGKLLRELGGIFKKTQSIIFSADGRLLISGGSYGTTNIWEVATGKHLVTLFTFTDPRSGNLTDNWLAYTLDGYYKGSPGVERYLAWRVGDDLLTAQSLSTQLHRPEIFETALQIAER
jgi:WD40 repeat protein